MENNMRAIHPGEILQQELEYLGYSKEEFCRLLNSDLWIQWVSLISNVLNKKGPVTPAIASILADFFSTTPDFWLRLQKSYDKKVEGNVDSVLDEIEKLFIDSGVKYKLMRREGLETLFINLGSLDEGNDPMVRIFNSSLYEGCFGVDFQLEFDGGKLDISYDHPDKHQIIKAIKYFSSCIEDYRHYVHQTPLTREEVSC